MIAIIGGLGAAVAWAVTTLCSARASRSIGSLPTLGWVMLVGLVPALAAVLTVGGGTPDGPELGWLALSGLGNVAGLGLVYAGMRRGQVASVRHWRSWSSESCWPRPRGVSRGRLLPLRSPSPAQRLPRSAAASTRQAS